VFLHQFAIALIVLLVFGNLTSAMLPLAIFGLLLLFVQALWVIPVLGLIGAHFRDLQPIITNLLQVLIFVTPVIWFPTALGSRRWIADVNPFHSLISVVREPLLGTVPSAGDYIYVGTVTVTGMLLAVFLYGYFRNRVIYWL
jgi:ABC-type polysaccharide/polyol phosphate export permease